MDQDWVHRVMTGARMPDSPAENNNWLLPEYGPGGTAGGRRPSLPDCPGHRIPCEGQHGACPLDRAPSWRRQRVGDMMVRLFVDGNASGVTPVLTPNVTAPALTGTPCISDCQQ